MICYESLKEILITQHECIIMGDFNLPNIDWTLGRPTPAPGSKLLQLVVDNNHTQHAHESTKQNNVLDLVMTTKEKIVSSVKIGDKIGDHQTIYFSIETEKESTELEKLNFNFRRANFDAMHDELVILERLIEGTDAGLRDLQEQSQRRQQLTNPKYMHHYQQPIMVSETK